MSADKSVWRPMSDAPTDGTLILCHVGDVGPTPFYRALRSSFFVLFSHEGSWRSTGFQGDHPLDWLGQASNRTPVVMAHGVWTPAQTLTEWGPPPESPSEGAVYLVCSSPKEFREGGFPRPVQAAWRERHVINPSGWYGEYGDFLSAVSARKSRRRFHTLPAPPGGAL